ncbi:MAG: organic hydroperoxide resistance protein [Bdellovibrionales bacterium]|nr:organic hydroperoxide resistance protein [Bdellovibrionales bacterium]
MKTLYQTSALVTGGRDGLAKSKDGLLEVRLSAPKELGGKGGATNPEQLFAAGYAACFESALRHVARSEKIAIGDTSVEAEVALGSRDDGGFQLQVGLNVKVLGVERNVAQKLMETAHNVCPYSHATRGNITVDLKLV